MDKHFLFDEIRCGFLIPTAVKQAWAAEIEVLQEIDRICQKHNISYYADWGTFLGTVRHGGFVPWDDDLDIVMKRDDLLKFLAVAPKEFSEGFHIQNFRNQPDYWLFMYKVVGRNHMCFEPEHLRKFHNFPYMACVDIFVLDYAHKDPEEEEKRRTSCKYTMGVADAIIEGRMSSEADIREHVARIEEIGGYNPGSLKIYQDPTEMGRYLYGLMEERFMEVKKEDATHLVQLFPGGLRNANRHYPIEDYDNPVRLPFEYTTIPVPRYYDYLLHKRYGEYEKFNKGGGAHDYPYFEGQKKNLLKVLDFDFPEFRFNDTVRERVIARMRLVESLGDDRRTFAVNSHKALIEEALAELEQLNKAMKTLPDAQQLAVDMGNLVEYLYGEGTETVGAIEEYCEDIYNIFENDADISVLQKSFARVVATATDNILSKKTVIFMPVGKENADELKPWWNSLSNDPNLNVYIMPLPFYYKDYDGTPLEIKDETQWWMGQFGDKVITANLAGEEFFGLLHPEMIFIQDPYDEWNPNIGILPECYASKLLEYTDELIYIPRLVPDDFEGKETREYHNMKYYVAMPGVVYADKTFVKTEQMQKMYIECLSEFAGEDTRGTWEKKIMVSPFVLSENEFCSGADKTKKNEDEEIKTGGRLLYGIGIGQLLEHENFVQNKLSKVRQTLDSLDATGNVSVCLYPPDNRKLTETVTAELAELKFVSFEEISADDYDAYYGDVIPVTAEFLGRKKPVMLQDWTV